MDGLFCSPRLRIAVLAIAFLAIGQGSSAQEIPADGDGSSLDLPPLAGGLARQLEDAGADVAPANDSNAPPVCMCADCQASANNPAAAKGRTTCCNGCLLNWSQIPTIQPMARPGFFPIPPSQGPAFFTLADEWMGVCREAPPKSGYAPFAINAWSFYDADWRYVDTLPWNEQTCVERLKRIPLNDCLLFSTGGEYWTRYHHEHNSRLTQTTNTFHLQKFRAYGDLSYSDWLRVYGEYVWADSFGEDLSPVPPDVDRGDLHNLFIDVKLLEHCGKPVYVRVGRQELQYGSQRLITPLPWANKRHAFEGVKVFRKGEKWDIDAFWTQYVPPQAGTFDRADENRVFAGGWLTYRPEKGKFLDFYYLMFDNDNPSTQQGIVRSPFETHTVGSRWAGDKDGLLWDFEGAIQFGEQGGSDVFAGMATAGIGRSWKDHCYSPTLWLYYDYASGDNTPVTGDVNTFKQQFTFGHYYMGWMDLVGRQNIHDVSVHYYVYPRPWMTVWMQYHHFWLDQSTDALYNAGGVAYRRDPTGNSGTNVGNEIGLVVNFHLTRYSDILASYNKLFGGSFMERTAGANAATDAETLYLMFQQRW